MRHTSKATAEERASRSAETEKKLSARDYFPSELTYNKLRNAAKKCEGCDLYLRTTQTVFGRGPVPAKLMLIGEAPGDKEDDIGEPFVGPAGKLLDDALESAGIDREEVYVTNAVKHFKWEPSGKRRLHAKPSSREIAACRPWLEAEIQIVSPRIIVCLGSTASQSLMGRSFRITRQRGQILATPNDLPLISTWHPSALLRSPDMPTRQIMTEELIKDLRAALHYIKSR
jgi:uracil-DNA glycosylase family protein